MDQVFILRDMKTSTEPVKEQMLNKSFHDVKLYAFSSSSEKKLNRIGYLEKWAYKFLVGKVKEDTHSSFQGYL